jgi:hypothetical protein
MTPVTAEQQFTDKVYELEAMKKVPAESLREYYRAASVLAAGKETGALSLKAANDLADSVERIQQSVS